MSAKKGSIPWNKKTHGLCGKPGAWNTWRGMLDRCRNPNHSSFKFYGGRGITVDQRWYLFDNFLEDMGQPKAGLTLDRIDTNGNYCKSNCRWVTRLEQSHNSRRNRLVTIGDKTQRIGEWTKQFGIRNDTFYWRLKNGWNLIDALTIKPTH